ncbi:MAG: hypothetical protein WA958_16220 [Tunicatimonas sp.]
MKLLENVKLDKWYGIVLYLGVALISASFLLKPEFVDQKHIFGLGLGMILIGIGYVMSEKYLSVIAYDGMLSKKINKHNLVTVLLITAGLVLIGLFGFKLVQSLI